MRRKIYKYPFNITTPILLEMPAHAEIVLVSAQGSQPCLWAIVDPDAPTETRQFRVYGAGHALMDDGREKHLGSFLCGVFVWHVFEVQ